MTDVGVDAALERTDSGEDGLAHLMCCHDDDAALCGGVLRGARIPDNAVEAECVVCAHVWESPGCPVFGRCLAVT